jgi:hypothetical protein
VSNTAPRRGWLLAANSVLVIATSIGFTSWGLALLTRYWDSRAIFGGLLFLISSAAIGVMQYRAVVRCNVRDARSLAGLFWISAGAFVFGAIASLAEGWTKGGADPRTWGLVSVLAAIGLFNGWSGWLNWHWAKAMEHAAGAEETPLMEDQPAAQAAQERASRKPLQFSTRELIGWVTVAAVVLGLARLFVLDFGHRFAEHVSADRAPIDLPAGASDVTFCHGYTGCVSLEFAVGEDAFLEWVNAELEAARQNGREAESSAISAPYEVKRYVSFPGETYGTPCAVVKNGHRGAWRGEEIGADYTYDLDAGRAYVNVWVSR